jgi:hypothetical protein
MSKSAGKLIALLTGAYPVAVLANAGLPMLGIVWPVAWLMLIPVIFIEAVVCAKQLNISIYKSVRATAVGNIASTMIGIPLTWGFLVAIQVAMELAFRQVGISLNATPLEYALMPINSAWIGGYWNKEIYFSFLFLCIPFCMVSIWIEHRIFRRIARDIDRSRIRSTVIRANVITYTALLAVLVIERLVRGEAT